jgi:hypothetical protein
VAFSLVEVLPSTPASQGDTVRGEGDPPPPAPGTPPKAIQEATLSGRAVKPDPFSQGDTSRGSPAPSRRPRSAARAAARPRGFKRSTPLSAPACCRGRVVGAEGGDHYCVHCVPPRRSPHPPQRPLPGRARAEALAPPGAQSRALCVCVCVAVYGFYDARGAVRETGSDS